MFNLIENLKLGLPLNDTNKNSPESSPENTNEDRGENSDKNSREKSGSKIETTDHIISGLIYDGKFRIALVNATDSTREAQRRHGLDPLTTIALGRALVCAALCGSTLKNNFEYISLNFQGDGPLRNVLAEFVAPGSLRGFVGVPQLASVLNPEDPVPEFVGEVLGAGTLTVRRALEGGQPYTGICNLRSGEIAEDVAHYFLESEQIPTSVIAGVQLDKEGSVTSAAGLIIQKIGSDETVEEILEDIEQNLKSHLAISKHVAAGKTIESIAAAIFGKKQGQSLERKQIGFRCFCSRSRMEIGLLQMKLEELKEIEKEQGKITTICHYCGDSYDFQASYFQKS